MNGPRDGLLCRRDDGSCGRGGDAEHGSVQLRARADARACRPRRTWCWSLWRASVARERIARERIARERIARERIARERIARERIERLFTRLGIANRQRGGVHQHGSLEFGTRVGSFESETALIAVVRRVCVFRAAIWAKHFEASNNE